MLVGFDTETLLIAPGLQHPPPVCLSLSVEEAAPFVVPTPEAEAVFKALLSDPAVTLVGHNTVYDLGCAVAWWPGASELVDQAVEAGRILDTLIVERLAEIGGLTPPKDLSLANLYAAHGLGELPKEQPLPDGRQVRLSYGPLYRRPLSEYHPLQIAYAANDAIAPLRLLRRQRARWPEIGQEQVTLLLKRLLPLADARAWGMRVNPDRLAELSAAATEHLQELRAAAMLPMLLEGETLPTTPPGRAREAQLDALRLLRANGTKNMKRLRAMVAEAYGGRPPMTDPPRAKKGEAPRAKRFVPSVKTARAVLEESGDPRLEAIAEYGEWASVESMVIPALSAGTYQPLHTKWRIVDSCRISSSAPNLTNMRRKAGIRECIVPRPGYAIIDADHEGLENATLAQVCVTELGRRGLADFYNSRGNLHCLVASAIAGCSYEEALARKKAGDKAFADGPYQCAKYLNFGRPGGAGWRKLQFIAKQMGHLDWTEAETKAYIAAHARAVPDLQAYLDWVSRRPQDSRGYQVQIPGTSIMRRGITYCSACNSGFQSLGAIVQIHVGWALRQAYRHGNGALRDCRVINHVHDSWMFEAPLSIVHEAAAEIEAIMCEAPAVVMPDVRLRCDVVAMAYWSKAAERVLRGGRLQVWPLWCSTCETFSGVRTGAEWRCATCGGAT
ncbi:MAG: DNA polymerase [Bacteroidales bacterium]|nr:DNA polymerase [Bacteroidales bacterium]